MFKKDGETKVFVKKDGDKKTANKDEKVRYTVDDLVKDSKEEEEDSTKEK